MRTVLPAIFTILCLGQGRHDLAAAAHTQIESFIGDHCRHCHDNNSGRANLSAEQLETEISSRDTIQKWIQVYERVASGEMPPKTEPNPDKVDIANFLECLGNQLMPADLAHRQTIFRRLNRVEYEHTVCDLLNIRAPLKEMLPQDASAHGFDTVGEALSFSDEHIECYLLAANRAVELVFGDNLPPQQVDVKMPLGKDPFASRSAGQLFLKMDDDSLIAFQDHWCPLVFISGKSTVDGTYRVSIQARAYQTQSSVIMAVYAGDVIARRGPTHLVGYFDVAPGKDWTTIQFDDHVEKGGCYQMKPYGIKAPTQGPNRFRGPGLRIGNISVEGPLEEWPPKSRQLLLEDIDPQTAGMDDVRTILTRLVPQAFRRRTEPYEIEAFVALSKSAFDSGRSFREALSISLTAILCSPEFLMREEPGSNRLESDVSAISDEALASRLSYFLWNSMPDSELRELAAAERLSQPKILRVQVERMLVDSKSQRFVENFTGQWLNLRNIHFTEPDAKLFPEFDEMLRHSMIKETHLFFREILDHNLPLTDFVDSDWAILNGRLASHYGISGVNGQKFRRVSLAEDSLRGGIITQASVLKSTANGTTTSPVVRGAWVLENLLGRPTPAPPGNVASIEPDIRGAETIREQLEKHRNIESCAICHNRIDPPGLTLESFDPIGGQRRWYRTLGVGSPVKVDRNRRKVAYRIGQAVDSQSRLPNGRQLNNIRDYKHWLLEDKPQLTRCLAEKLLTYSLGRELGFSDRPAIQQIHSEVERQHYGFRSLIHEVIQSPTFRQK